MTATIIPHPLRAKTAISVADLETVWRETAGEYLFAVFNGAPSEQLQHLAREVFFARAALQKHSLRHDRTVPRPRIAVESRG